MGERSTRSSIFRKLCTDLSIRKAWKYFFIYSPVAPYLKKIIPQILHQKLLVYPQIGYWPDIRNPKSFNEKLLHRKLFTNDSRFSIVEDKYRVREYVADRVGDDILPELYHVTDDPNTIPFEELPEAFVIKPSHLSGPIRFVDDKHGVDYGSIKESCEEWLDQRHGSIRGEYWYDEIDSKILVEERLRDDEFDIPIDFKFFVFHGRVEYVEVDMDRFEDHTRRFYDREWEPQEFGVKYPVGDVIDEPERLDEMITVAERLGADFDFIRVDLYQPNGERIVFGELTVAHGSGEERFTPQEYDFKMGELW